LAKVIIEVYVHLMLHKLGHTPYIGKQTTELAVVSFTINIIFGANYVCIKYQMTQLFMNKPYKALTLL
jgi:hypothetical protein